MKSQDLKKLNIPDKPGVYFFKKGNPSSHKATKGRSTILYVGKATSLRSRVRSYFSKDLIATRGPLILDMTVQANALKWQVTDSVLEALILEASLIKKYQPKYNTKEKDNKSFNYVCITREKLPKVLVVRGRKLKKLDYKKVFGPFPNGLQLREAMRIVRRILPYIDAQSAKKDNFEFYHQLGLTPEILSSQNHKNPRALPASGLRRDDDFYDSVAIKNYKKNITNLELFFEGKKKKIISNLKKDMMGFAKKREFEKAGEIKKKIFALEHINDVALIKDEQYTLHEYKNSAALPASGLRHGQNFHIHASFRIEAYDIAHMSGKNMVGVMTVVISGEIEKGEYKKFIIKTQTNSNDTGALEEVLSRRFRHTEWGLPSLVVVDGSTAQLNVAKRVLNRYQFDIPIVAVVKDDKHKAKAIIGDEALIKIHKKSILLVNSEAHRFGIAFHKKKRNKNFLNKKYSLE